MEPLVSIRDLKVWFPVRTGIISGLVGRAEKKDVRAVDGISLDILPGEIFCLVGESGCGKTTTGKAVLRLNDVTSGHVLLGVQEDESKLLGAIDARLHDLESTLRPMTKEERSTRGLLRELQALKDTVIDLAYDWSTVSARLEGERRVRSVQLLEKRIAELRGALGSNIPRPLSRTTRKLEIVRSKGAWFTLRRADRSKRLERSLAEAEYRLRRAEASRSSTRAEERAIRRLRKKLEALRRHEHPQDPQALPKLRALEAKLENERRITRLELQDAEAERARNLERLEAARRKEAERAGRAEREYRRIASRMAEIREMGGIRLEYDELVRLRNEIVARYDLARWDKSQLRELRKRMQIIYQDPYESLNPKFSIFDIVAEPLLANRIVETMAEAEAVVREALEDVGLKPADEYMFRYPHELSGGQRQRVGIAAALVIDPDFIVADEPLSMLDASVRTEILALLLELKRRRNLTYLFITHDLGLAWVIADRVAVMYLGKIVEMGDGPEIIRNPRHPYTKALISVVPSPNPDVRREKTILRGERPNAVDIPSGCRFHPRCPVAIGMCGWSAQEVQEELADLVERDAASYPAARNIGGVAADGPFGLQVATADSREVERYLRERIAALGAERPALASIRQIRNDGGSLHLDLHVPTEPPLRQIRPNVWAACHLVEPEIAPTAGGEARGVPVGNRSLSPTPAVAR